MSAVTNVSNAVRTRLSARPPAMRGYPYAWLAIFLLGMILFRFVPSWADDQMVVFNQWIYFTILVIGFYFVFGVSGQFAFSQAAFAMVGGYTSAWATREGVDWILAVALGIAVAAVIAFLFAWLARKATTGGATPDCVPGGAFFRKLVRAFATLSSCACSSGLIVPAARAWLAASTGSTGVSTYGNAACRSASVAASTTASASGSPTRTGAAAGAPSPSDAPLAIALLLPLLPGQYIARSTTIGSLAVTVVRKLAALSPGTALA